MIIDNGFVNVLGQQMVVAGFVIPVVLLRALALLVCRLCKSRV